MELPGVSIDFLPIERPNFANTAPLADHFLGRRLLELRLAQNFEGLLCLGSLNGVDSYVYQHENSEKGAAPVQRTRSAGGRSGPGQDESR